jgi:hypothetical protein
MHSVADPGSGNFLTLDLGFPRIGTGFQTHIFDSLFMTNFLIKSTDTIFLSVQAKKNFFTCSKINSVLRICIVCYADANPEIWMIVDSDKDKCLKTPNNLFLFCFSKLKAQLWTRGFENSVSRVLLIHVSTHSLMRIQSGSA